MSLLEEEDAMDFESIEDNLYSEVFTTQQEKDEHGRLIKPTGKNRKSDNRWREWFNYETKMESMESEYENKVRREHISSKPSKEVLWNWCEKFNPNGKFVNHKLKYDYCASMHGFIKYRNFEAASRMTSDNII